MLVFALLLFCSIVISQPSVLTDSVYKANLNAFDIQLRQLISIQLLNLNYLMNILKYNTIYQVNKFSQSEIKLFFFLQINLSEAED